MNPASFIVTRQMYYHSGENVVEIAQGGLDYSGSDMLVPDYRNLGEGEEFTGAVDAVEAAIAVAKAWKKDGGKKIKIGLGNTQGMGLEIEGENACEKTYSELRKVARKIDENLPHCPECGEIIATDKTYGNEYTFYLDKNEQYPFCSDYCANKDYERQYKIHADEEE